MDNELSRIRKEAVTMNLIYFTNICLERLGKVVINLSQVSRCLCRRWNPRTAECKGFNRDVSAGTFNSVKVSCLMCTQMQSVSILTQESHVTAIQ